MGIAERCIAVLLAAASFGVCAACGDGAVAPSPPSANAIITFNDVRTARTPVTLYAEGGFTVSPDRGAWITWTEYGNPKPFIVFESAAGNNSVGEVAVFADRHASFRFTSVDLYSSTTPIPYTITGYRNDAVVFTVADRLPNTFGNFRTVVNPRADERIDTLIISLSNAAAACCANPMGLDNIALAR